MQNYHIQRFNHNTGLIAFLILSCVYLSAQANTPTIMRIVSLSPHATELIYSAGAGHLLVGVDNGSDFPPQVKQLPNIGNAQLTDIEAILALKPDLVVIWKSGTNQRVLNQLQQLGINIFSSEPLTFEMIAHDVKKLGQLTGNAEQANQAAQDFLSGMADLRQQFHHQQKLSVFYQVWNKPIITLNHRHFVSRVIDLCGGKNIYNDLNALAPTVSLESVLIKNPQVMIFPNNRMHPEKQWLKWPQISAVANQQFIHVNPDWMQRPTFRLLNAAKYTCAEMQRFRHPLPTPNRPTDKSK